MAEQKEFPKLHHPGFYKAKVIGSTLAEAATGTTYLALKVEILSLKKALDGKPWTFTPGSWRDVKVYLTEKTMDRARDFLVENGFTKAMKLEQLSSDHPKYFSLKDKEIEVQIKHKVSTGGKSIGQTFDEVQIAGGGNNNAWMQKLNKANTGKLHSLDLIFGSQLKGQTVKEKAQEVVDSGSDLQFDPQDEDIPF